MELYLSIPFAVTIVAIFAIPPMIAGGLALVGHGFAGSRGARTAFIDGYGRSLLGVLAVAFGFWILYGSAVGIVHLLS